APAERWALLGAAASALTKALQGATITIEAYPAFADLASTVEAGAPAPKTVILDWCDTGHAHDAQSVHGTVHRFLSVLQQWLKDDRLASSRLVILTHRAMATQADEDVLALASAACWGLVRSALNEHPDRQIVLVDLDDHESSLRALPIALAAR